jgi:alkylation response protein AidB-like acyl-CoA dehydrogenase
MNAARDEARDELVAVLRDFLGKSETAIPAGPAPFKLDRAWWRQLADLGLFSLARPEDDGGLGMGLDDLAQAFEVLGENRAPGPLVWTQLAAFVDPAIAGGDVVAAGVDLTLVRPGDAVLVPHFDGADKLLVLWTDEVRLFEAAEVESVLLDAPIDPDTPVSRIGFLPDAPAAADPELAGRLRRIGGLLNAATMLGISQTAIDVAVAYAKERHQFGRPIGSFQSLKHLLADAYTRTNLARAAAYAAAELEGAGVAGDGYDLRAAQLLAAKAADKNARTAVQVFGGMGFARETPPHLLLKRTWLLEHEFGTAADHASAIAETMGGGHA